MCFYACNSNFRFILICYWFYSKSSFFQGFDIFKAFKYVFYMILIRFNTMKWKLYSFLWGNIWHFWKKPQGSVLCKHQQVFHHGRVFRAKYFMLSGYTVKNVIICVYFIRYNFWTQAWFKINLYCYVTSIDPSTHLIGVITVLPKFIPMLISC